MSPVALTWYCVIAVVALVAVHEEMIMRKQVRRDLRELEAQRFRQALETPMEPDPDVRAWTPQEREALGVNDTIELIDRIDKELGREYAEVRITPGEHVYMSSTTHITQEAS